MTLKINVNLTGEVGDFAEIKKGELSIVFSFKLKDNTAILEARDNFEKINLSETFEMSDDITLAYLQRETAKNIFVLPTRLI